MSCRGDGEEVGPALPRHALVVDQTYRPSLTVAWAVAGAFVFMLNGGPSGGFLVNDGVSFSELPDRRSSRLGAVG